MPDLAANGPSSRMIPPEIVYQILTFQFRDLMSNDYPGNPEKFTENFRTFVRSNLTVNKTFYHICRVLIYRYCNLTTAKRFHSLLEALRQNERIRNIVQVADFQELTSIGLGRSGEMNKMIKNLTNETLSEFLQLTKFNLREFLACEHIQDDLDANIVYHLLRPGTVLSVLDFCGCSGAKFTESCITALERLYRYDELKQQYVINEENYQVTCLGLNDCTDLPSPVLGRILQMLPELQKLDLGHTSIDDETLMNSLPHLKNLTHLSLSMCLRLSPRGVLEFFSHHPALTDENNLKTLEWLNLYSMPHSSSWTSVHTMFLLKKLCQFGHNKTLQYLNLGGMPFHESDDRSTFKSTYYYQCSDTLQFIKYNFPKLKSLSIRGNNFPISKICDFLKPVSIQSFVGKNGQEIDEYDLPEVQQLKFLNISNNVHVNKWTINDPALFTSSQSLVALEVSFDAWQQVEKSNERHEIIALRYKNPDSIIKDTADAEMIKWRCYIDSSYGRRYWLHRVDEYLNPADLEKKGNISKYDSNGNKIIEITKQPDFLKFAQSKIMLGCGIVPLSGIRRKECYRDLKPPISHFFTRSGNATLGQTPTPILGPRLPPGGWRVLNHNEEENGRISDAIPEEDEEDDEDESTNDMRDSIASYEFSPPYASDRTSSRNGLYWDRSMQNLQLRHQEDPPAPSRQSQQQLYQPAESISEVEETDDEYLNDTSLQRRRSQLSILGLAFSHPPASHNCNDRNSSSSLVIPLRKPKNYYQLHPQEFFFDAKSPETTKLYRIHFELVSEYEVFGCIERGMYRYYGLKT
ncbi:hypothetical protein HG537_0A06430 [Torulaspora globosa]|uniref:F-box domain-containing protein n=1 Tax=Torulaspora globosa TaxID=48254 RepID=A0A7H9HM68_9SACH|nr:hypothetical protein HG537_0A06430 [Torulaspora sp. CBS 2947]